MSALAEIQKAVLALPLDQRALLAVSLLDSLPAPAGQEWSTAEELAEVARRDREIEDGKVRPLNDTDFWQRIEARRNQ